MIKRVIVVLEINKNDVPYKKNVLFLDLVDYFDVFYYFSSNIIKFFVCPSELALYFDVFFFLRPNNPDLLAVRRVHSRRAQNRSDTRQISIASPPRSGSTDTRDARLVCNAVRLKSRNYNLCMRTYINVRRVNRYHRDQYDSGQTEYVCVRTVCTVTPPPPSCIWYVFKVFPLLSIVNTEKHVSIKCKRDPTRLIERNDTAFERSAERFKL